MSAEHAPEPHLRVVGCESCERYRTALDAASRDLENLEVELRVKRSRVTQLQHELAGKRRADPLYDTAFKCWSYWKAKCRPKARKMSDDQLKALLKVLKAKLPDSSEPAYPPRYVCEAILGASVDHYVDPKGKHHNGLELVCAKVEDFHERFERARRQP